METQLLQDRVRLNLELLYQQRTEHLQLITLDDILTRAPHNLWSTEEPSAPDLVARLLEEYLASFEGWWTTLLQDTDFCLQAIQLQEQITTPRYAYHAQWASTHNRLVLDFINRYCRPDFAIDWAKLLRFNSSAN
jgi:hypothetical protein